MQGGLGCRALKLLLHVSRYSVIKMYYYIDMSVLPKNREIVFYIRNYSRDTSEIFSISSIVKISLMSFLCFAFVFRRFFIFETFISM